MRSQDCKASINSTVPHISAMKVTTTVELKREDHVMVCSLEEVEKENSKKINRSDNECEEVKRGKVEGVET